MFLSRYLQPVHPVESHSHPLEARDYDSSPVALQADCVTYRVRALLIGHLPTNV